MLVRCIKANVFGFTYPLTIGKYYEVLNPNRPSGFYEILNDKGVLDVYLDDLFEEVKKMSEKVTLKIDDDLSMEKWGLSTRRKVCKFSGARELWLDINGQMLNYDLTDSAFVQKRITLNPLPKPKFDFKNHLADNHFMVFCKPIHSDSINKVEWSAGDGRTVVWSKSNTIFTKCGVGFEATKQNAEILIKMAKLAEELK